MFDLGRINTDIYAVHAAGDDGWFLGGSSSESEVQITVVLLGLTLPRHDFE